jgi:membrane fusion protein, multidrug efflux system
MNASTHALFRPRLHRAFLAATFGAGVTALVAREEKSAAPPPPPEVKVMAAASADVPVVREWVATLDGTINAVINAQVPGYITRLAYTEGSPVKKGALLFEIDDRPFVAAQAQAKAQIALAEAQLGKTEMDVKRYTPLAKTDAISQQELDDAVQAQLGAKAKLEAARAAQQKADIDLEFTKVVSPIDGIAGFAKVNVGDLVGPGTGPLTTVSQIDPIRAFFTPSEREYLNYRSRQRAEGVQDDKDAPAELSLVLADGSTYPEKGKIIFADRQVDGRTGSIKLASAFPNPDGNLRPGMFARLQAVIETRKGAVIVPQRAVQEVQGSYQIVVVGADGKADVRPVKLGERIRSDWVVLEGLKAGEQIVVEGLQKARSGMVVKPVPFEPPSQPDSTPSVANGRTETGPGAPTGRTKTDPAPASGKPENKH